jgi:DNA-binding beta-propeller fold protein YncE
MGSPFEEVLRQRRPGMDSKRFGTWFGGAAAIVTLLTLGAVVAASPALPAALSAYTAYVMNTQCPQNNSLSVVTGAPWRVGKTIPVGSCPAGVVFTRDGSRAYVLNAGDSTITPIDTASATAGAAFPAGVNAPLNAFVTRDGKSIVTSGAASNTVAVISTADPSQVKSVKVGPAPVYLAVLPNGHAVYTANATNNTVSVVSLGATPRLTKTIKFPALGCRSLNDIVVAPNGRSVYVDCRDNYKLWKINVATGKPQGKPITIPGAVGGACLQTVAGVNGVQPVCGLWQFVITPNGKTAYVANYLENAVYPVTLATGNVGAAIHVPSAYGLAVSPDGAYVLAAEGKCCFIKSAVYVIKVATNHVAATFSTGGFANRWIAFKP